MTLQLPEYLKNTESKIIKLEGKTVAEYKIFKKKHRFNVNVLEDVLVFVVKGTKNIQTTNSDITINKGEGIYLQKGNYVMSQILEFEEGTYESFLIFINDIFLKKNINDIVDVDNFILKSKINYPFYYQFKTNIFIDSCLKSFFPYFKYKSSVYKKILDLKIKELLINLISIDNQIQLNKYLFDKHNNHQIDIMNYMNQTYTKNMTLEQFAKKTNRSLSVFKKEFKKIFKQPPKEWINMKRLATAKNLIKYTNKSINDISFLVGYENYSYFIQLFKKKYKMTPKQYRKLKDKESQEKSFETNTKYRSIPTPKV